MDRALAAWEPDDDVGCVLTARVLPDGTGLDLCDAIRADDRDLPVVLVGDDPGADVLTTAFEVGVTRVLGADAATGDVASTVGRELTAYAERRRSDEESELLDLLLGSLDESIYVKDEHGRHVRSADFGGGLDESEARGKTDLELYSEEDPEHAREAYEDDMRVIEDQEPLYRRIEHVSAGHDQWFQTTKVPWIGDDGTARGLAGLTLDVTEFKKTERRLDALERRFETFVDRLSHDVKTPLQVASGTLELALDERPDESVAKALDAIERAEQIVDDYDGLSKRARVTEERSGPVRLGPLVEDAWESIEAPDADLVVDADDLYVNATDEMTRPIVENLLKNAVTHTDPGVTIRVGETDDGFYVEDTGSGIPEADRERVLADGYTTAESGTGRGLSIVTNEIEKHVWTLDVGSGAEGGARFEVNNCRTVSDDARRSDESACELDETITVGDPDRRGHAIYDDEFDRWILRGEGADVYRGDNEFCYVAGSTDGPVSIQGRVIDVEYVDDHSKGGFMVRSGRDEDAAYVGIAQTPGHGSEILYREAKGEKGYIDTVDDVAFAFDWYRLDRVGDEVSLFVSMDGERWQSVGSKTVALTDPIHVGMVACSCLPGRPCEVTFEGVTAADLETR